ncbi:MAG: baseplate J/gp47 family protein, partial [Micrococcales bacterium]|nr:baseplate J/gp47 family protein [Micrococcales bacterium]
STLGYEFWARLADPSITDVAATNAAPGVVQVVVVTGGGGSGPTPQGILDLVEAKLSPDDVRPLGDQVIVIGPTTVPCAVDVTYHVPAASAGDVQRAVEEPGGAIDDYYDWQCGTLGRGINPDQLRKRILQAGATRVTVTSPSDTPLAGSEIAVRDTTVANVVISED